LDDELDWPDKRPASVASLRGRAAQNLQRQINGAGEFHAYHAGRPVASVPSYLPPSGAARPPSRGSRVGEGAYVPPSGAQPSYSSGSSSQQPKKYSKPPVSEARRKVRDLLCKSKNDPRYFED